MAGAGRWGLAGAGRSEVADCGQAVGALNAELGRQWVWHQVCIARMAAGGPTPLRPTSRV